MHLPIEPPVRYPREILDLIQPDKFFEAVEREAEQTGCDLEEAFYRLDEVFENYFGQFRYRDFSTFRRAWRRGRTLSA